MKKLLTALTVVACMCIASSAMASSGHQCIQISYKWYNMSDFAIANAKLYDNGSFQTDTGGVGYWEKFGSAFMLQYTNGSMPLYAGTTKQGFMETFAGSGPTGPNYYLIKKSKNCAGVDAIVGGPAEADGPNDFTPE